MEKFLVKQNKGLFIMNSLLLIMAGQWLSKFNSLCHSEHFDRLSALLDSETQTLYLVEMLNQVQHDK